MKLKHYDHDGRARFVTFCTHHKLPILSNHLFRDIVVDRLYETCTDFHLKLLAYVVMLDHVHLVVVPPDDLELGPIIGDVKRHTARDIHKLLKGTASDLSGELLVRRDGKEKIAVWQRRCFDHNCRTTESVWEKVNYCHNNPVRKGLVRQAADWQWSSFGYYASSDNVLLEIDVTATD
jgi:putative transposase